MHTVGLQTVHKLLEAATCFGAEAPSLGSLKYRVMSAPVYQSGKYNAKY